MRNRESHRDVLKTTLAGMAIVLLCGLVASAASYARTTLKELTDRAVAVVEVQVVGRHYPPMNPGDNFPRTQVDVKVLKSLKGNLGESFQLDLPGGIDGNSIGYVPDAPDFHKDERAIVFVKEPEAGHFMVQDLGLGKYSIVERDGGTFVENATCPGAIAPGQRLQNQKDVESTLITKSVPYATFCALVEAYANGRDPEIDPSALAARLPGSSLHAQNTLPAVVADARALAEARQIQRGWLLLGIIIGMTALIAALLVARRRKAAVTVRNISLLVFGAMLSGAALGGAGAHAFVQFTDNTIWALDTPITNKVANQTIIWSQTPSVSKSNPAVFTNVAGSFTKWASVAGSRLNFSTRMSSNTTAVNSTSDGENIIAWSATPSGDFSASTLAITFSSFSSGAGSAFQDGDIIFNDRDFQWGPGGTGNSSSVSLHEIGHFVGLAHTMSMMTVMFPFDQGFTDLTADEIAAAIALYPGTNSNGGTTTMPPAPGMTAPPPPTAPAAPPIAAAQGSPTTGTPGLVVNLTSTGSGPGPSGSAIQSFEWDFGDGTLDSGPTVTHTYQTVGTFSATVQVTDGNGMMASATVKIQVGASSTANRGSFKLNFSRQGNDTFSAMITDAGLVGIKAPRGQGKLLHGSVNIGDQPWQFDFDTSKLKTTNSTGPKISVNDKSGTLTLSIKSADLTNVLDGLGASNDDVSGVEVDVPVQIWFGQNSGMYPFAVIPFQYSAKSGKSGTGKF